MLSRIWSIPHSARRNFLPLRSAGRSADIPFSWLLLLRLREWLNGEFPAAFRTFRPDAPEQVVNLVDLVTIRAFRFHRRSPGFEFHA